MTFFQVSVLVFLGIIFKPRSTFATGYFLLRDDFQQIINNCQGKQNISKMQQGKTNLQHLVAGKPSGDGSKFVFRGLLVHFYTLLPNVFLHQISTQVAVPDADPVVSVQMKG